jgi:hypothetical protein
MKELKGLNNQYTHYIKNKSKRITAVYLITKEKIYHSKKMTDKLTDFYYIGSSINLESRLKDHISK